MDKSSKSYQSLCAEYYDLDKPAAPEEALRIYLDYAKKANGTILEPMCGTGRFLIPLLREGFLITGFDSSEYMLNVCRRKCNELGLTCTLFEANFDTFSQQELYKLIMIPSSSFCLLTDPNQVHHALDFISNRLHPQGRFVFEIETLKAVGEPQNIWKGKWITKSDGSKLVLSTCSNFDKTSSIETVLCRYELWENNTISRTEVEELRLRLYDMSEIELLLEQHGLGFIHAWQAEPYAKIDATSNHPVVIYECVKI